MGLKLQVERTTNELFTLSYSSLALGLNRAIYLPQKKRFVLNRRSVSKNRNPKLTQNLSGQQQQRFGARNRPQRARLRQSSSHVAFGDILQRASI